MDDVATMKSENANLRKIQSRLLQWEQKDNPLAPLSSTQNEFINRLTDSLTGATSAGAVSLSSIQWHIHGGRVKSSQV